MNWVEQFLLFVADCQLLGNHGNLLGFFWFISLTGLLYSRLKGHFQHCYHLNCPTCEFTKLCCPNRERRLVWYLVILFVAAYMIFFFQMLLDDMITSPINLLFGAWELRAPVLGAFSVWNWLMTKWDVYSMMMLFFLVFSVKELWRFFHFTKQSAFWLICVIGFSLLIANTHWWTHLRYDGWMRIQVFWLSYPEFRILTGFFVASIIKPLRKPL